MKTRITLGIAGALIALTVSLVAFAGTPGAIATQGQAVIAGQDNTETSETRIFNTNVFTSDNCGTPAGAFGGLFACGNFGVSGTGRTYGLSGRATSNGIAGVSGQGPTGVSGLSNSATVGTGVKGKGGAVGIFGETFGGGVGVSGTGGNGVYGEGTENGVQAQGGTFGVFAEGNDYGVFARGPSHGVFGQATASGGAGVDAAGSNGALALRVTGKAKFSRSGITTIAAGASSKTITLGGVTTASMVLATSQQSSTVFVRSAVPASGSFTIRLSGAAPTGGLKVAYFVLN